MASHALSVGPHAVEARYLGGPDLQASDGRLSPEQMVEKATVAVRVTSTPNPSLERQRALFDVTVAAEPSGSGTPPGDVELLEGAVKLAHAAVTGGQVTIPLDTLRDGRHSIVAVFHGNRDYTDASSEPVEQHVKDLRAIDVTPLQLTLRRGETFQLRATGRYAGGPSEDITNDVQWSSAKPAVATVSKTGLVTIPESAPEGSVTIVAHLVDRDGHASIVVRRAATGPPPPSTTATPTTGEPAAP